MPTTIALPESYMAHPFKNISISYVPETSPTPTKVVLLKLNRPRQFNAVTPEMIEELITTYGYFEADDRIKAVVVTGSGPTFCAGADLRVGFSALVHDIKKDPSKIESYRDGGGRVALAIHNCSKPTIMAINGPAAGFGNTLTLPATIRVTCAGSKISFSFSRRGRIHGSLQFFSSAEVGRDVARSAPVDDWSNLSRI